MDKLERVEKAKEAYAKCLDALSAIQEVNSDLRLELTKSGFDVGYDHKVAIGALTDATRNLDVVLLSLQSGVNHLDELHKRS